VFAYVSAAFCPPLVPPLYLISKRQAERELVDLKKFECIQSELTERHLDRLKENMRFSLKYCFCNRHSHRLFDRLLICECIIFYILKHRCCRCASSLHLSGERQDADRRHLGQRVGQNLQDCLGFGQRHRNHNNSNIYIFMKSICDLPKSILAII
jgi:hypothetical protein